MTIVENVLLFPLDPWQDRPSVSFREGGKTGGRDGLPLSGEKVDRTNLGCRFGLPVVRPDADIRNIYLEQIFYWVCYP